MYITYFLEISFLSQPAGTLVIPEDTEVMARLPPPSGLMSLVMSMLVPAEQRTHWLLHFGPGAQLATTGAMVELIAAASKIVFGQPAKTVTNCCWSTEPKPVLQTSTLRYQCRAASSLSLIEEGEEGEEGAP